MKSLLWKELRQLAPWSALMLLATAAIMIGVLVSEFDGYRTRVLVDEAFAAVVFVSGAAAILLGFLQTVLEVRRDQWAFLVHRGLSATQIFLAKVVAGLAAYAAITLVPVVIAAIWCGWGGVERFPFSWHQLRPMLVAIVASAGLYFATILGVVWKGPWYFSRLLPLAAPVLVLIAVVAFALEFTEYVPLALFLLTVLAVGILGVAAWGAFVRAGEAPGRPISASVCLGIPVFVAIFGAGVGLFAFAAAIYEAFTWERQRDRPVTWLVLNRAGHVCRIELGPTDDRLRWSRPIASVTDLDEPDSSRYASLAGKHFSNQPGELPGWDPLPSISVRRHERSQLLSALGSSAPRRVLDDLGTTGQPPAQIHWVFSSADGWIYGYREEYEERRGRQVRLPPQLAFVVGPDGFTDAAQRPQGRFGRLLFNLGSQWLGSRQWIGWPGGTGIAAEPCCLVCVDGLYLLDPAKHTVRQVLAARDGREIRGLERLDDAIAVVYDDAIAVYAVNEVPLGARRNPGGNPPGDAVLHLPGELRYMLPLPEEVAACEFLQFGRLPGQDVVVLRPGPDLHTWRVDRFVYMKLDGTVLRTRDFPAFEKLPPEVWPPFCGLALLAPAGPVLLASATDAAVQLSAGGGPGILVQLCRASPQGMGLVFTLLLGTAAVCGWSAGRTARKYGFTARARRAWQWVAILLGPAGLVTLWFLRDWPAREACPSCGSRRPVTCDRCPHCGQTVAPPTATGTEILIAEAQPRELAASCP